MKEIAFTVNPDSELYANHFIQKAEKKRFAELASAFLNAHAWQAFGSQTFS